MNDFISPFLAAILNASTDAVVLINGAGIIISVNEMTVRMFGHSTEKLVGSNVSMLMPEPYSSNHDGFLRRFAETSKPKIIGKTQIHGAIVCVSFCFDVVTR